jgi:hypothetical protein
LAKHATQACFALAKHPTQTCFALAKHPAQTSSTRFSEGFAALALGRNLSLGSISTPLQRHSREGGNPFKNDGDNLSH